MFSPQRFLVAPFVLVVLALSGCGQQAPAPPLDQPQLSSSQDLMTAWMELPKEGHENLDVVSAQTIAGRLLKTPEGLTPILDVLATPDADPVAKVLAVITLSPHVNAEMVPRLVDLTQPGRETTTRACATNLLGLIDTPEAKARVKEMLKDSEHRVKCAAAMILGARGDQEVLESLPGLWADPQTTAEVRDQIMYMIPESHVQQHLDIYKNAVLDHNLEVKARERFTSILGHVGDASVIPLLEEAAEKDPEPSVRVLARSAVDAVTSRLANPVPELPAITVEYSTDGAAPAPDGTAPTSVPAPAPAPVSVPEPASAPAPATQ